MKKRIVIPLVLVVVAYGIVLLSEGLRLRNGERPLPLYWSASVIILISTLVLRFWSVDEARFAAAIQATNPVAVPLHPRRFLNWLVVAMAVGLAATIAIYQNFFLGAGIYLLMQLCLIRMFSGIVHVRPRVIRETVGLARPSRLSILFWLIITPLVFVVFVYRGTDSLIVAPYVAALGLMALVVYLGLGYGKRPLLFRVLPALGATLFVFSDALIGHMVFVNPDTSLQLLISPTYILAIILLSHAVLFWPDVLRE